MAWGSVDLCSSPHFISSAILSLEVSINWCLVGKICGADCVRTQMVLVSLKEDVLHEGTGELGRHGGT